MRWDIAQLWVVVLLATALCSYGGYHHTDPTAVENRTLFYDLSTSPETLKYKRSDGTVATIA